MKTWTKFWAKFWAKFEEFGEDGGVEYLTPGKWYPIVALGRIGFEIEDDEGVRITCLKSGCAHIKGDWKIEISEERPE